MKTSSVPLLALAASLLVACAPDGRLAASLASDGETAALTNAPAPALTGSVDRIVFDGDSVNATGTTVFDSGPLVLMKDGVACSCLDEDLATVSLEDIRRRRPDAIGEWRAQGSDIQVTWGSSFRAVRSMAAAAPLGDDWRPDSGAARYRSVGAEVTFGSDGRFTLDGGVGIYSVSGWMLMLTYDDGHVIQLTAVRRGDDPKPTVWLGGVRFTAPS